MNVNGKINFIACIGVIVVFLISNIILSNKLNNSRKTITELNDKLKQYESVDVPFKGEIDSLKVNIIYRDSIINRIKIKYVQDVEVIKNMPDSAAVILFDELVWADDAKK